MSRRKQNNTGIPDYVIDSLARALLVELSKEKNIKKLRGSLIGFIICAALLFLSLIAVWILGNAEWLFCNVM